MLRRIATSAPARLVLGILVAGSVAVIARFDQNFAPGVQSSTTAPLVSETGTPVSQTPTITPESTPAGVTNAVDPTATAETASVPAPTEAPTTTVAPASTGTPLTDTTGTTAETSTAFYDETGGGGGGKNVVLLKNGNDNRLRVKGSVQFNRIPGPTVQPENLAIARASCTDCQTFSVALQINLISKSAAYVSPRNAAVAVNSACTRCRTIARAVQYTYSVDDPTQVPREVTELVRSFDRELKAIHAEQNNLSAAEAEARIDGVVARFQQFASSLTDARDEQTEPDTANPGV